MATVQVTNRRNLEAAFRKAASNASPDASGRSPPILQELACMGRCLLGAALLLVGILAMSTLWLLPVGLPLALVGAALISAPAGP
jgi:hypothetical protein